MRPAVRHTHAPHSHVGLNAAQIFSIAAIRRAWCRLDHPAAVLGMPRRRNGAAQYVRERDGVASRRVVCKHQPAGHQCICRLSSCRASEEHAAEQHTSSSSCPAPRGPAAPRARSARLQTSAQHRQGGQGGTQSAVATAAAVAAAVGMVTGLLALQRKHNYPVPPKLR